MSKKLWIVVGVGMLIVLGVRSVSSARSQQTEKSEATEVVNDVDLKIEAEGALVGLEELIPGCPIKDCIHSIDEPEFESLASAGKWLQDDDLIFILEGNQETRFYPQKILNRHEIVNDWFGSEAVAVTFCPLCGTATAFSRTVHGVTTEFGVSGRLYNSDLVMYDRYEGSLWSQVTAEALTGPAARRHETLDQKFMFAIPWSEAREEFPQAQVLSRVDGFFGSYDVYPYGDYESNQEIGVSGQSGIADDRLHPKDVIWGIEIDGQAKAYSADKLANTSQLIDVLNGVKIEITSDGNQFFFKRLDTNQDLVPLRSFWFAWVAFHPETEL